MSANNNTRLLGAQIPKTEKSKDTDYGDFSAVSRFFEVVRAKPHSFASPSWLGDVGCGLALGARHLNQKGLGFRVLGFKVLGFRV